MGNCPVTLSKLLVQRELTEVSSRSNTRICPTLHERSAAVGTWSPKLKASFTTAFIPRGRKGEGRSARPASSAETREAGVEPGAQTLG